MNIKSVCRHFALSLALFAVLGLLVACSQKVAPPEEKGLVMKDVTFETPKTIPTRYEDVTGTSFFTASSNIKEQLALMAEKAPMGIDSFFILINPKKPTEGILAKAKGDIATEIIEAQVSRKMAITGNVSSIACPNLVKYCHENYGIDIAADAQGNPIFIDCENDLDVGEARTPATSAPADAAQAPDANATQPTDAAQAPDADAAQAPEANPAASVPGVKAIDAARSVQSSANDAATATNAASAPTN